MTLEAGEAGARRCIPEPCGAIVAGGRKHRTVGREGRAVDRPEVALERRPHRQAGAVEDQGGPIRARRDQRAARGREPDLTDRMAGAGAARQQRAGRAVVDADPAVGDGGREPAAVGRKRTAQELPTGRVHAIDSPAARDFPERAPAVPSEGENPPAVGRGNGLIDRRAMAQDPALALAEDRPQQGGLEPRPGGLWRVRYPHALEREQQTERDVAILDFEPGLGAEPVHALVERLRPGVMFALALAPVLGLPLGVDGDRGLDVRPDVFDRQVAREQVAGFLEGQSGRQQQVAGGAALLTPAPGRDPDTLGGGMLLTGPGEPALDPRPDPEQRFVDHPQHRLLGCRLPIRRPAAPRPVTLRPTLAVADQKSGFDEALDDLDDRGIDPGPGQRPAHVVAVFGQPREPDEQPAQRALVLRGRRGRPDLLRLALDRAGEAAQPSIAVNVETAVSALVVRVELVQREGEQRQRVRIAPDVSDDRIGEAGLELQAMGAGGQLDHLPEAFCRHRPEGHRPEAQPLECRVLLPGTQTVGAERGQQQERRARLFKRRPQQGEESAVARRLLGTEQLLGLIEREHDRGLRPPVREAEHLGFAVEPVRIGRALVRRLAELGAQAMQLPRHPGGAEGFDESLREPRHRPEHALRLERLEQAPAIQIAFQARQ
jgi:hypothetical protein